MEMQYLNGIGNECWQATANITVNCIHKQRGTIFSYKISCSTSHNHRRILSIRGQNETSNDNLEGKKSAQLGNIRKPLCISVVRVSLLMLCCSVIFPFRKVAYLLIAGERNLSKMHWTNSSLWIGKSGVGPFSQQIDSHSRRCGLIKSMRFLTMWVTPWIKGTAFRNNFSIVTSLETKLQFGLNSPPLSLRSRDVAEGLPALIYKGHACFPWDRVSQNTYLDFCPTPDGKIGGAISS